MEGALFLLAISILSLIWTAYYQVRGRSRSRSANTHLTLGQSQPSPTYAYPSITLARFNENVSRAQTPEAHDQAQTDEISASKLSHALPPRKPSKRLSRDEFTVGWIAALSTELSAAREYLEEEFIRPEALPRDGNIYTLGRIGKHNVVIATLPKGEYGTAPAATVAKDLARTFPNVKFGLMVGIGGGVPSPKNDIRLGDVVVSLLGVYQYDYGKSLHGGKFEVTRVLDQPPQLLRTAVTVLDSEHQRGSLDLEGAVLEALDKASPISRLNFGRPQNAPDFLFSSTFPHSDADKACAEICATASQSRQRVRPPRSSDVGGPVVHYGVIASGDSVMKDALLRDKIAKERDVLCFEMEAAGLMNHFPCLVIRGICDYADSHKNKAWQGFAAMTAAAYAKQLLDQIEPEDVQIESTINAKLENGKTLSSRNLLQMLIKVVQKVIDTTSTEVKGRYVIHRSNTAKST